MPTYQYACTACDHRFEAVQAFTDPSLTECPECAGRLRKVYGSVGVVFKGSGFYHNDSRADAKKSGSHHSNGTSTNGTSKSDGSSSDSAGSKGDSSSGSSSSSASGSSSGSAGSSSGSGASSGGSGSSGTSAPAKAAAS